MSLSPAIEDVLISKTEDGSKAAIAFDVLEKHLAEITGSMHNALLRATDKDAAWLLVLRIQALNDVFSSLKAAVVAGNQAARQLKGVE